MAAKDKPTTRIRNEERPFLWSFSNAAVHLGIHWARECKIQTTINHPCIARLVEQPKNDRESRAFADYEGVLEDRIPCNLSRVGWHVVALHLLDGIEAYARAGAPPPILARNGVRMSARGAMLTTSGTLALGATRGPPPQRTAAIVELQAIRNRLAPELRQGDAPATLAASIYSYGLLLTELALPEADGWSVPGGALAAPVPATTTAAAAAADSQPTRNDDDRLRALTALASRDNFALERRVVGACLAEDPNERPDVATLRRWLTVEEGALVKALGTEDETWHGRLALYGLRCADLTPDDHTVCAEVLGGLMNPNLRANSPRVDTTRVTFEMGGLDAVLTRLQAPDLREDVARVCCECLISMCASGGQGSHARRLLELGVDDVLMHVIETCRDMNEIVLHNAAWALTHIGYSLNAVQMHLASKHLPKLLRATRGRVFQAAAVLRLLLLLEDWLHPSVAYIFCHGENAVDVIRDATSFAACIVASGSASLLQQHASLSVMALLAVLTPQAQSAGHMRVMYEARAIECAHAGLATGLRTSNTKLSTHAASLLMDLLSRDVPERIGSQRLRACGVDVVLAATMAGATATLVDIIALLFGT